MPTIVLTGFLGAGKTTLLNRLLAEGGATTRQALAPLPLIWPYNSKKCLGGAGRRGRKFAVIENEVGAVGIDGQLIAEARCSKLTVASAHLSSRANLAPCVWSDQGMRAEERQKVAPCFVELSDGCVCCTVRGDLQEALHALLPKLRVSTPADITSVSVSASASLPLCLSASLLSLCVVCVCVCVCVTNILSGVGSECRHAFD